MKRQSPAFIVIAFILTNLSAFTVCRLLFLYNFAHEHVNDNIINVLAGGLRLDLSLLSCELLVITLVHFIVRNLSARPLFLSLWTLTGAHFIFSVGNHLFFAERNQHVAEMLLAYITSPHQAWIATYPFIAAHPILFSVMLALTVLFFVKGYQYSKSLQASHKKPTIKYELLSMTIITLLFVSTSFSYIAVKKTRAASGEQLKFVRSSHYAHFSNFTLNQAVINPIHELLFFQLPSAMKNTLPFALSSKDAFNTSMKTLKISHNDPFWPLLRSVEPQQKQRFNNIITVQIEGLTASIFEYENNGLKVMPYLNKLANQGIYFPNTIQSFNATAGAVFSTITGLHKVSFDEKTKRFTSAELNTYYGSLPHILGRRHHEHYYFGGFRQSALDFLRFMGNQGYQTYGYEKLSKRLNMKGTLDAADSTLGLFDEDFLVESAKILNAVETHYNAHLMTATSHSPWTIPDDAKVKFNAPALDAFAYVDTAIQQFMHVLQQNPKRYADTLFVFVADHTSHTFGDKLLEKIRIPLIFYTPNKALSFPYLQNKKIASHVDIIPTILSLLTGEHQYSGMGSNLFSSAQKPNTALSGSRNHGIYIHNNQLFQYLPYEEENKLESLIDRSKQDAAKVVNLEKTKQKMKHEYLAQYELSKRLSLEKKVFPQHKSL